MARNESPQSALNYYLHFHHITVFQYCLITSQWRKMAYSIVNWNAGWECHTPLDFLLHILVHIPCLPVPEFTPQIDLYISHMSPIVKYIVYWEKLKRAKIILLDIGISFFTKINYLCFWLALGHHQLQSLCKINSKILKFNTFFVTSYIISLLFEYKLFICFSFFLIKYDLWKTKLVHLLLQFQFVCLAYLFNPFKKECLLLH